MLLHREVLKESTKTRSTRQSFDCASKFAVIEVLRRCVTEK